MGCSGFSPTLTLIIKEMGTFLGACDLSKPRHPPCTPFDEYKLPWTFDHAMTWPTPPGPVDTRLAGFETVHVRQWMATYVAIGRAELAIRVFFLEEGGPVG